MDNLPFPNGRYNVIYADPPWSYKDKLTNYRGLNVEEQYITQDIQWIKSLPLSSIASKDCACFMWVVSPQLPEGLEVLQAWGFKFKTVAFVWNKQYKGTMNDVSNLGRWTMGSVEICLLGTKGHPQRVANNVPQVLYEARGRHSEKPHEVRERIVKLMGDVPRIELFARKRYRGWQAWGNEVEEGYADDTPLPFD